MTKMTRLKFLELALEGAQCRRATFSYHGAKAELTEAQSDYEYIAERLKAEEKRLALKERNKGALRAAFEMVGEARAALDANAIERHRKERARAFAEWELATKPYEGWGR